MKRLMLGFTILCAGGLAAAAADDAPFAKEIKARQGLMEINALNIGILYNMSKGNQPYDAAAAKAAADAMVGVYNLDLPMLWPEGSDTGANPNTRAKPEIWGKSSDIGAKVEDWGKAALAMQAGAGDLTSLQAAMGPLDAACSACHKEFRASK